MNLLLAVSSRRKPCSAPGLWSRQLPSLPGLVARTDPRQMDGSRFQRFLTWSSRTAVRIRPPKTIIFS